MNTFKIESSHLKSASLSAIDTPITITPDTTTPLGDKIRKSIIFSITDKSKRILSFRGGVSRARSQTTTTTPLRRAGSIGSERDHITPTETPATSSLFSPRQAQSEIVRKRSEFSLDYHPERPESLNAATTPIGLNADAVRELESPTTNIGHKRGLIGGEESILQFMLDAQLKYAASMEALSTDFSESIFPDSPLLPSDIARSSIDIPFPPPMMAHDALKSSSTYMSYEEATPLNDEPAIIEYSKPPATAVGDSPESGTDYYLHMAETLQQAARRLRDDEDLSPVPLFRTISPIALFLYVIGVGVFLPRNYDALNEKLGATHYKAPLILLAIAAGIGATLLLLKATIWIAGVLGQSFCEMDLAAAFQKGGCVDSEGTRVGEGQLAIGSFLFGSAPSPSVPDGLGKL